MEITEVAVWHNAQDDGQVECDNCSSEPDDIIVIQREVQDADYAMVQQYHTFLCRACAKEQYGVEVE
ncbi:MAG: hypothetical protein ACJ8BW_00925 [Ktedonobacteraceae bacterium]